MSRYGKPLLATFFVLLVMELMIIAPRDVELVEEPEITFSAEELEDQQVEQAMTGVRVVGTRNEAKEWQLWADRAVDYKNEQSWTLKKVKAIFFSAKGGTYEVVGDRGYVELVSKDMRIEGNVVTTSSNGYVFKTEEVVYRSIDQELISPRFVDMKGPIDAQGKRMSLQGGEMTANLRDSLMEVKGRVQAEKPLEGERKVTIDSDTALFSGQSNSARFKGKVVMEMGALQVRAPAAEFRYDRDKGRVVAIEVTGGVKVNDLDKWATSDRLDVELDADKFVFSGSPRVVQADDELRGEEIVFHNGGDQVEVRKARARVDRKSLEKM